MSSEAKVLILMDDAAEARDVSERLAVLGVESTQAADGISGVAAVSDLKPDVVLVSRDLPKMDGLQVCRLIKKNHKLKHVAVLVVLDSSQEQAVSAALEVGANDYLVRPLRTSELVTAVRSHLQAKTSLARLKDDNRELATVLEIAEMLTSTLSSTELFYIIVHRIAEALAVDRCAMLRVDASGGATIEASMDPEDADCPNLLVSDLPEVVRALAADKMVYVEDASRDAEMAQAHGDGHVSILAVPLPSRRATSSRIVFRLARRDEPLTYREIKFCQIVTTVAANALENATLYESLGVAHAALTEASKRDPLTNVYNRRYLFERLEIEMSRRIRKQAPLACIMLDIDHFKRVNDELGHQVGDQVLIGFGQLLRDTLRGQDIVGRYGGEEFLLVLPETDREAALLVAERIRRAIHAARFEGVADRRLTASLGVAVVHPDAEATPASLVNRADKALYEAKVLRDCTVLFEADESADPTLVGSTRGATP